MISLATKEQILQNAGYSYNFDRELYLNRKAKKAFSVEFVEDSSEEQLKDCLREGAAGGEGWRFFFINPPSESVKRELTSALG